MRPFSERLTKELLRRHARQVAAHPPGAVVFPGNYTITYSDLALAAGQPGAERSLDAFLLDVANECVAQGWPPLHSLVVRHDSGLPGDGYDGAGVWSLVNWKPDVEKCIRFTGYPSAGAFVPIT